MRTSNFVMTAGMAHRFAKVWVVMAICGFAPAPAGADELATKSAAAGDAATSRSHAGRNEWNRGREPKDWWNEIENRHGHVGPWNVLGYRMGKAILRECKAEWGDHSVVVTSHIPMRMPYSCILDGLAVGTGNSEGRLDLKSAEVASVEFMHISARPVDRSAKGVVLKPNPAFIRKIEGGTVKDLDRFSKDCEDAPEGELFSITSLPPGNAP
ncbi:MAG: formylmethanofuran dehydrogenase subunit E family protein [Candidatus Sumerlaeaceae bacterium]|nr:formylmethanofuran dehydrogenase subunit E family protein [Candidatus Sumerlaeaceae bacterium]